jgi:hypothetical protein
MFSQSIWFSSDPAMVSSNRNTQEYVLQTTNMKWWRITNPLRESQILTSSYQATGGNRQLLSSNSQSLDRAIARWCQMHDVDVCGAGKAYDMVAKMSAIINSEMQN